MPVQSLVQLARKACIKNVNSIVDIGDAEYDMVRPILLKLQNPKQLYQLEQICPQIIGDDAEIWKEFCKRDVPNYEKNPREPTNPINWYKCYQKLYKAGQKEIDEDAALLKATMDNIKIKQAQKKAQQVELRGVKVPNALKKDIPTIALPKSSGVYRAMGHAREYGSDTVERGPSKVLSTLEKIRKETAAQSHFAAAKQLQRGLISPRDMRTKGSPTKTIIKTAPKSLIEEHQKAKIPEPVDPTIQPTPIFNPKKRRIEHVETSKSEQSSREAREKRLKALTNPSRTSTSSSATIAMKANTPPHISPKFDHSHRQELAKTEDTRRSPSQDRTIANTLSLNPSYTPGNRSKSPISRTLSSSTRIRPPMRINRASDNPLMTARRRPLPQS